jgi:hypothetical protein
LAAVAAAGELSRQVFRRKRFAAPRPVREEAFRRGAGRGEVDLTI